LIRPGRKLFLLLAVLLVGVLLAAAWLGRLRPDPAVERCGEGLVALGPRCCGEGQRLDAEQRCAGEPARCAAGQRRTPTGCVPEERRVFLAGGRVHLGPSDWEAQGVVASRTLEVASFWMDRAEITEERRARCAAAGACAPGPSPVEPGRAALLTPEQAEALCRWSGGRLPTEEEWIFAAAGAAARRYPWGDTGAVCRRAAFGLASGPCAHGARGPDTSGAHPDGDSPEGLADLAGNVAEWVRRPDGTPGLRGGSYRSALAAQLRGWSSGAASPREEGGARCAYDHPG
jgi:formylglycine-generating enzyme required for sulfatase activity